MDVTPLWIVVCDFIFTILNTLLFQGTLVSPIEVVRKRPSAKKERDSGTKNAGCFDLVRRVKKKVPKLDY